jgi:hypothetical protein
MVMQRYVVGIILISVSLCFSLGQEFIKQPKVKKFYPSCQQCIELEGEIVGVTNKVLSKLIQVQKSLIETQESCLQVINNYLDGEKECFLQKASKHERADEYAKKIKKKHELESFLRLLDKRVNSLLTTLNE